MIRLNCFFQAAEGKYDEALEAAIALTACSQQEEGCIAYDTFESSTRADILMICETWTNDEALAAHSASEHFKKYVGLLETLGTLKLERFEF
ncbi:MAG TPA: putative quinol monooxygenase [Alloprevotella sp.]|nr:putative quinol monooxygenase [Alloprevotella sp.]